MYQVMVIDDHVHIRERLKRIIQWQKLQLEFCCEAGDGDEALELFRLYHPKIVIADINLPGITGLEVADEILKTDPDVKIIIITGYNDFKYVQDAVKLGVVDLIAKPIKPEELNSTLKKVILLFEKEKLERLSSQNIRDLLEESLPVLKEKFIQNLLTGMGGITEEKAIERLKRLDASLLYPNYCVAVISLDLFKIADNDVDLMLVAVKNISDELIKNAGFQFFNYYDPLYHLVCILGWKGEPDIQKLESALSGIRDKLRFYMEVDVSAGIGQETNQLTCLASSYKSAVEALNYKGVFGQNNVVNIRNVQKLTTVNAFDCKNELKEAVDSFKTGDFAEVTKKLNFYMGAVIAGSMGNIEMVKKQFLEYISVLFTLCAEIGVELESNVSANSYYTILTLNNLLELNKFLLSLCEIVLQAINSKRSSRKNKLIQNAKNYVQEHLQEESLGLKSVSEAVGLSSVYFCQLFRNEENMSFNEYLTTVRIERAKDLLKNTNLKVYETAYKVGYENPKYFNFVFKKIVGLTPLEYKDS